MTQEQRDRLRELADPIAWVGFSSEDDGVWSSPFVTYRRDVAEAWNGEPLEPVYRESVVLALLDENKALRARIYELEKNEMKKVDLDRAEVLHTQGVKPYSDGSGYELRVTLISDTLGARLELNGVSSENEVSFNIEDWPELRRVIDRIVNFHSLDAPQ